MSDPEDASAPIVSANTAASTSLRETAKWMVGGVTATAVGIFAGSSLTKLGSLDFAEHPIRLSLAIIGVMLGFAGLALILMRAVAVLTVESLDFETLAKTKEISLASIRDRLEDRYKRFPGRTTKLATLLAKANKADGKTDSDNMAFMATFTAFLPFLMADAGFLNVRAKFDLLVTGLYMGAPIALAGFGLFAWAANPPDAKPPPAKLSLLIINQP